MKVQPCPACGARYNTSRLEDGATFQCRRCGADVVVGAGVAQGNGAPGLALGGLLMIAASFLYANPRFGYRSRWPWEQLQSETDWTERATVCLWAAAAVWALLASLVPARRVRAAVATALAAPLILLTTQGGAAFQGSVPWNELLALTLLGAGLLLSGEEGHKTTGRLLALGGGLLWIAWPAFEFVHPEGPSSLRLLVERLVATVSPGSSAAPRANALWEELLPALAFLLAAAIGLLAAVGAGFRGLLLTGFFLLLAGFLLPALSQVVSDFDALQKNDRLRNLAFGGIVGSGLALWLLATFTAVDLARARRIAPAGEAS